MLGDRILQHLVQLGSADSLLALFDHLQGCIQHLPNSQLRIYPDSGHGFLDQYPELFADHVRAFLNGG